MGVACECGYVNNPCTYLGITVGSGCGRMAVGVTWLWLVRVDSCAWQVDSVCGCECD